jgi:hypothetical protein
LAGVNVWVFAAFVAAGQQDVSNLFTGLRPFGNRTATAKFGVVWVGGNEHNTFQSFRRFCHKWYTPFDVITKNKFHIRRNSTKS